MRILELIIILVSTYFAIKSLRSMKSDASDLSDENAVIEDNREIMICISEEISGQIYVWNTITDEFVTQGKSVDQIVDFFKEKYPNKKVILTRSTNEEDRIRIN